MFKSYLKNYFVRRFKIVVDYRCFKWTVVGHGLQDAQTEADNALRASAQFSIWCKLEREGSEVESEFY